MFDLATAKKFVINLDRRPDRWAEFQEQANRAGLLNFERVTAIDGHTLDYDGKMPLPTSERHMTLSLHERQRVAMRQAACRMSHLRCIEIAKAQKLPACIIFEDDADIDPGIIAKFNEWLPSVPDIWMQLYLGAHNFRPLDMTGEHVGRCVTTLSTIAYIIRDTAYDLFIGSLQANQILDIIYCNHLHHGKKIPAYCFKPNLVVQRKGFSDIEGLEVDYKYFYNK